MDQVLCASNFLTMRNNSKVLKTLVKTLGPQNNQICDKILTEINQIDPELTRPIQVTDRSDVTVENLWVKLCFKAPSDDRTRSLSIGMMCSRVGRK